MVKWHYPMHPCITNPVRIVLSHVVNVVYWNQSRLLFLIWSDQYSSMVMKVHFVPHEQWKTDSIFVFLVLSYWLIQQLVSDVMSIKACYHKKTTLPLYFGQITPWLHVIFLHQLPCHDGICSAFLSLFSEMVAYSLTHSQCPICGNAHWSSHITYFWFNFDIKCIWSRVILYPR